MEKIEKELQIRRDELEHEFMEKFKHEEDDYQHHNEQLQEHYNQVYWMKQEAEEDRNRLQRSKDYTHTDL